MAFEMWKRDDEVVDFRSDTVTVPSQGMYAAILSAPLGDDVFGDDPTVNALQERVAKLLGKEAGLFCPTGVMANQLGILANLHHRPLTSPSPEVICDARAHVYECEVGGIAFHSRASIRPITVETHLTAEAIEKHIQLATDVITNLHHPRTALICLENTLGGDVMPLSAMQEIHQLAKKHSLPIHLDGARLWNASVKSGVSFAEYGACVDTVSVCLSKGLGSPIGSVLVGPKDVIRTAHHFRKVFGGGLRQAGILAAAGMYAIDNNWKRMSEDHENAAFAAKGLRELGFEVKEPQTNIVWVDSAKLGVTFDTLKSVLAQHKIRIPGGGHKGRLVMHLQVTRAGVEKFLAQLKVELAKLRS